MKSIFSTLIILVGIISYLSAQTTVNISQTDITIIKQSINYVYTSQGKYNAFKPDYTFYKNALEAKQQKYDRNYKLVSEAYGSVYYLSLINTENKGRLSKLLESLNATAKDPKTSKIDWSDDAITESYVKYYTSAFDDPYIKDEISMLQNLDKEINRIKLKDPDGFYKSERYMELGKALEELKICGATEIGKLAWKYGLI